MTKKLECPCGLEKTCQTPYIHYRGPDNPEILVVGEAPGAQEDKAGDIFIGRSGQLLRMVMEEVGFNMETVGFTNTIHCRPPNNKTPTKAQLRACKPNLKKVIEDHQENLKMVIAVGATAATVLTGRSGITKYHGKPVVKADITYIPIYHPAYILRNRAKEPDFILDLKRANYLLFGENRVDIPHLKADSTYLWDHLEEIESSDLLAFDTETGGEGEKGGLRIYDDGFTCIGVSLAWGDKACFVPLDHKDENISQTEWKTRVQMLTRILQSPVPKVGHNTKFDKQVLFRTHGIWPTNVVCDTQLDAHLLNEVGNHSLSYLTTKHFTEYAGYDDEMEVLKQQYNNDFRKMPLDKIVYYASGDAFVTLELARKQEELLLAEELYWISRNLAMPANDVYARMETAGVGLDVEKAQELKREYERKTEELEALVLSHPVCQRWCRENIKHNVRPLEKKLARGINQWGNPLTEYQTECLKRKICEARENAPVNLNSPTQLVELFYGKRWFHFPEKTKYRKKTGKTTPTTDKTHAIEPLLESDVVDEQGKEFLEALAAFKRVSKLHSTYASKAHTWLYDDGKVHSSFNQSFVKTGRLSNSKPNLQNIPKNVHADPDVDSDIDIWLSKHSMKGVFVSKFGEEGLITNADFSQLELRIMAALSGDEIMCDAYHTHGDLHRATAKIIHPDFDDVGPGLQKVYRSHGKTKNFSSIYAMRPDFLAMYPGLEKWVRETVDSLKKLGYAVNPFGRRRRVPLVAISSNPPKDLIRQGVNFMIQSTGHDMLMRALIKVHEALTDFKSHVIFEVHDSIVVDTHASEADDVARILIREMEDVEELEWYNLPMVVDVERGKRWSSVKEVSRESLGV